MRWSTSPHVQTQTVTVAASSKSPLRYFPMLIHCISSVRLPPRHGGFAFVVHPTDAQMVCSTSAPGRPPFVFIAPSEEAAEEWVTEVRKAILDCARPDMKWNVSSKTLYGRAPSEIEA